MKRVAFFLIIIKVITISIVLSIISFIMLMLLIIGISYVYVTLLPSVYIYNNYGVRIAWPQTNETIYNYEYRDGIDFYKLNYDSSSYNNAISSKNGDLNIITNDNINEITEYYIKLLDSYFEDEKLIKYSYDELAYWKNDNESLIGNHYIIKQVNPRKVLLVLSNNNMKCLYVFYINNWQRN